MAGSVLVSRGEAISRVCSALGFPWELPTEDFGIESCIFKRVACDMQATVPSPEWNRSTRDGFAVDSVDTCGASSGAPVFLSCVGEVKMGEEPTLSVSPGTCAVIHTGGILPRGADAVLMLEDAAETASLVEARRAVQSGENIIRKGEEFDRGATIIKAGDRLNFSKIGTLASMGVSVVKTSAVRVGILSTGDEIVEIDAPNFSAGKIRDVNTWVIKSILEQNGYQSKRYGIVGDDKALLWKKFAEMAGECDVVLLSGGSSVSVRDHTEGVLSGFFSREPLVKGVRMAPGKPTLIAGGGGKLAFGLPGHPLSCLTVMFAVVLPLLNAMLTGTPSEVWTKLHLCTHGDVFGKTGIEEFVPCRVSDGTAVPMPSKSGYIGVNASGFIRLADDVETVRAGGKVEVLLL